MFSVNALVDIHDCSHQSFSSLLVHCSELTSEEINRGLPGFGYSTVHQQFHHAIGAERYWIGVLQGRIDVDEDSLSFPTIEELNKLREQVFEATNQYLGTSSEQELNQARTMMTWGNREKLIIPAQVVLRTQTHLFHHQGQIAAMCRLLGKPSLGSDYPIE